MKFDVGDVTEFDIPQVGFVYPVMGGMGRRFGFASVIVGITPSGGCVTLTIDREGRPVGAGTCGIHYLAGKMPVAFVAEIENLTFKVEPLP